MTSETVGWTLETGQAEAERRIADLKARHERGDPADELVLTGLELCEPPARLVELTWLKRLDLSYNYLDDQRAQPLSALTSLTALDLSSSGIGDAGVQALAGLSRLTTLDIGGNQIDDAGARTLSSLTGLTTLRLWGNRIGDKGAQALSGLSHLETLDLGHNFIGDEGATAIARLENLTTLHLGCTGVRYEGVRALAALTGLTFLDLGVNGVEDIGALTTLAALEEINLSDCSLVEPFEAFWRTPSLRKAVLVDAEIYGVPSELLSRDHDDNCLPRLLAHFDAQRSAAAPPEV